MALAFARTYTFSYQNLQHDISWPESSKILVVNNETFFEEQLILEQITIP